MRSTRLVFVLAILAAACSRSLDAAPLDGADGGSFTSPPPAALDAAKSDALEPISSVRFAHVAPFGAVDFCYEKTASDQIVGPLFGAADAGATDATSDASDAGATGLVGGLDPMTLSRTFRVSDSGKFHFSVIAAGSTSCANPVAGGDVTLEAGRSATIVLMGARSAGDAGLDGGDDVVLSLASFADDPTLDPAKARVRLVHAALGDVGARAADALSVTAIGPDGTISVAPFVEPRKTASTGTLPPIDVRGYATVIAFADPARLQLQELGDASAPRTWSTFPSRLGLAAGTSHTGFLTSTGAALQILWCEEAATGGGACESIPAP